MLNHDRGSALFLMPSAVLAVLVLAAITMDLSLVHLARREAVAAAESAANDATTYGLDELAYRRGDGYVIDVARARVAMERSLAASRVGDDLAAPPRLTVTGTTVEVQLVLHVDYVFAPALPGVAHATTVTATGSATPVTR